MIEERTEPIVRMLSGNEAVARGAWEAGVAVASAYPGTPSTEILEEFARFPGVYAEWATNEKVAVDVAIGAAYAGKRALATMKHVGLNVAADAFMYAAMTGAEAGLVIVSADDPAMHSSQNEQDNRAFAKFARVPCIEPADSQEAKDFTVAAFALSEQFDTPVLLRLTTRICHSTTAVSAGRAHRASPGNAAFPAQHGEVRDGARQCAATTPRDRATPERHRPSRRDLAAEPCGAGRPRHGYHHRRRGLSICKGSLPHGKRPQARHDVAAARRDDPRLRGLGGSPHRDRRAGPVHRGGGAADGHPGRGQAASSR